MDDSKPEAAEEQQPVVADSVVGPAVPSGSSAGEQVAGEDRQDASGRARPDVVVLSDLHLGEGLVRPPSHYSALEEFFQDDAFARMLAHLQERYRDRPEQLQLLFNGDVFDFLAVSRIPDEQQAAELGIKVEAAERRFGLKPTPERSVFKLDAIMDGHPRFFEALARFVAAGHRLVIVRGNHDLELFFKPVRKRFLERLCEYPGGPTADDLRKRVRFHQWFYMEPGRLYAEHGNQYEASNSIRFPLRPVVGVSPDDERLPQADEPVLDYPLGSLFVRFFYNRVHRADPYIPKVISFEQYLEFVRRHNLLDLLRIARDHYPFFLSALAPDASLPRPFRSRGAAVKRRPPAYRKIRAAVRPKGILRRLSALKIHPMTASKLALAREMFRPMLRRLAWVGSISLATLYLWLLIFNLIQATPWLAENVFGKATLLAMFSLGTALALFWLGNQLGWRLRRQTDQTVEMCARRAGQIAGATGVRLVVMGHTHMADIRKVAGGKATYANSGTWTPVENPWRRLVHGARERTFLYVRGEALEVCRWNDEAGRIELVPFFDVAPETARENQRTEALGQQTRKPPVIRPWWRLWPSPGQQQVRPRALLLLPRAPEQKQTRPPGA